MLKKTTLAVLGLAITGIAAAGSMGPVREPGNVKVRCEGRGWGVGIDALYLQTSFGGELGYYGSNTPGLAPTNWQAFDRYNWGFKLEGSYHFSTGKDIIVDWYHLNTDNTYSLNLINTRSQLKTKWDAVNLELAQLVDFSANKKIRFHGGLAYARISTNVNQFIDNVIVYDVPTFNTYFSGIGPRTGIDLNYVFGKSFGIYSKAAAALLVGTGNFRTYNGDVNSYFTGKRNPLVPVLDAKLGAKYAYNMAQGDIILDAGWMWTNYFQSQHKNTNNCDSNFSLSGPYIGLNYVGNL